MFAFVAVIGFGITLRYLAPERFAAGPTKDLRSLAACAVPCWPGESCVGGVCTHAASRETTNLRADQAKVRGPFSLPKDATAVMAIDDAQFGVGGLLGLEFRDIVTGDVTSTLTEALHTLDLFRVDRWIYAVAPSKIHVIDPARPAWLKAIELGGRAWNLQTSSVGNRVVASIPTAQSLSLISPELHTEIDRIHVADDRIGHVAIDDVGARAVIVTGRSPVQGMREPSFDGALYAIEPNRYASEQDRIRASVPGNPVAVLLIPDGTKALVALRASGTIQALDATPSGSFRHAESVKTCREPDALELIRPLRKFAIRCADARSVEVMSIAPLALDRHLAFDERVTSMAVSPSGQQLALTLSGDGHGALALIDLTTGDMTQIRVSPEPTALTYSPSGRTLVLFAERTRQAWTVQ